MDGNQNLRECIAPNEDRREHRLLAAARGHGLLFGAVTFLSLVTALTLSAYGHRPAFMLPVAVACAVVFIRHGDGRRHSWIPASTADEALPEGQTVDPGTLSVR